MPELRPARSFVERACPVCQGDRSKPELEKDGLRAVRCAGCGMVFANPVESRFASGSFYDGLAESFYLSPAKLAGDFAPVRFARELRLFRRHCPGGTVLDVGCCTGGFLHQLAARFPGAYSGVGMDVAGAALDHAERSGVRVERGDFVEHDFGGRRFQAVTMWAVLEHVPEPGRFLTKAARVLEPGGHCFVLVPNLGSLAFRTLGARYRYAMPEHLNYFSAATLRALVAREPALELERLTTTHFNPLVLWEDWRRGGRARVADADRARLLERTTHWKRRPWLAPARWLYGAGEAALRPGGLADNLVAVLRRVSCDRKDSAEGPGGRKVS